MILYIHGADLASTHQTNWLNLKQNQQENGTSAAGKLAPRKLAMDGAGAETLEPTVDRSSPNGRMGGDVDSGDHFPIVTQTARRIRVTSIQLHTNPIFVNIKVWCVQTLNHKCFFGTDWWPPTNNSPFL